MKGEDVGAVGLKFGHVVDGGSEFRGAGVEASVVEGTAGFEEGVEDEGGFAAGHFALLGVFFPGFDGLPVVFFLVLEEEIDAACHGGDHLFVGDGSGVDLDGFSALADDLVELLEHFVFGGLFGGGEGEGEEGEQEEGGEEEFSGAWHEVLLWGRVWRNDSTWARAVADGGL